VAKAPNDFAVMSCHEPHLKLLSDPDSFALTLLAAWLNTTVATGYYLEMGRQPQPHRIHSGSSDTQVTRNESLFMVGEGGMRLLPDGGHRDSGIDGPAGRMSVRPETRRSMTWNWQDRKRRTS
jgi:hypothetical protein